MKRFSLIIKRPPIVGSLICLVVFSVIFKCRSAGQFEFLELKIYDQLLKLQPRDTSAADQIAVVGIDELDIRAMGAAIITDRNLTRLIDRLGKLGAAAIGLDLNRDQLQGTQEDRRDLLQAIKSNHVYCVEQPDERPTERIPGPAEMYDSAKNPWGPVQLVSCELPLDVDGEARQGLLCRPPKDQLWKGLSLLYESGTKQDEVLESSLSTALAYEFLYSPRSNADPVWRLRNNDPDDSYALGQFHAALPRFEQNGAAYVSATPAADLPLEYLIDFKGPRIMGEDEARPGDSLRFALRQILQPADFQYWNETRQELADYARRHEQLTGKQVLALAPVNEARNRVRGKIILIGQGAASVKDYVPCPRGTYFRGLEYHALATDYLLRVMHGLAHPRQFAGRSGETLWIFAWSLLGVAGGYCFNSLGRLLLLLVLATVTLTGIVYLAFVHNLWLPSLPPAICFIVSASLMTGYLSQHERTERTVVNNLFRRMSGDAVVAEVWAKRDEIFENGRLSPRVVTATMLIVDFEGFSSRTEVLSDPQRLNQWLFETMQAMTQVTLKSGGTILRYMGDSFLVAFGAPVYRSTAEEFSIDAKAAVQCALAIRGALIQLNQRWVQRGEPDLRIRIGISTGKVAAGSIGAGNRMEYTVLGDTVNTASRLENCLKERMDSDVAKDRCRILISESTADLCDGMFTTFDLGLVDLRKPSLVHVFAVLDVKSSAHTSNGFSSAYPTADQVKV